MASAELRKHPPSIRTTPAAEGQSVAFPSSDMVTSLRVVGTQFELPLQADKHTFAIGSRIGPQVDLRVTSTMRSGGADHVELVSRNHALIERRGNRLTVRDLRSTNGTFVDDRREEAFDRIAGQTFRIGDMTLLAMDERLRVLHTELRRVLGLADYDRVDRALQTIVGGEPLLLIGARGCEQRSLADHIHRSSPRRGSGFVVAAPPIRERADQVRALSGGSHGTLFIDLKGFEHVSSFFVTHLFGATYRIRPIVAAPTFDVAAKAFGTSCAALLRTIEIPRLEDRRADVPALLDDLLGAGRSVAELGPDNVSRLVAFDWPDNFEDLRRNAPRIRAYLEHGGVRPAAPSLGVSHAALLKALHRIGIVPPPRR